VFEAIVSEFERKNFLTVKFSRHAKRRAKLYKIPEATVKRIVETSNLNEGENELIEDISGFKFPIKIVVTLENDTATIVTNYPLKKGRRK